MHTFRRCVAKHPSKYLVLKFSHFDQFSCMAFAQLIYRESLRDIEICLRAYNSKLYHLGIYERVSRSTLADTNKTGDVHIYENFALALIKFARKLPIWSAAGASQYSAAGESHPPHLSE
ncbi:MAG TPA: DUF4372 domain-containing protein [Gallionellaceae bacterium]|nr:DUF4372 domain-containing protein [Gallionellaceae bacterium]